MILQGALKHPWFPEPSELRTVCERAMEPVRDEMRRVARQREIDRQKAEHAAPPVRTEAELARHKSLMADFNSRFKSDREMQTEIEREEIRARYGMTEDVLSKIKDAPRSGVNAGDAFGFNAAASAREGAAIKR